MKELLVAARIPEFLERSPEWFSKNRKRIGRGQSMSDFWRRNAFLVNEGASEGLRALVERLVELGYRISPWPETRGEFTMRGGAIIIFPVNERRLWRVEFLGNTIDEIREIPESLEENEKKIKPQELFEYLRGGDFVVHENHGIGIWRGITTEKDKKYFLIEYKGPRGASPDTLLVPVQEQQRITPYIGFRTPQVSRLGTPLWKQTIKKIKEDALLFARRLLELAASREVARRSPYLPAPEIERPIEADFPHQETPSQIAALEEIMRDLASETPMDRIVVGDVGFGKTELALRASVRVASSGAQVAVLAPTTLLADQHYRTWQNRLKKSPLKVARLSRLEETKREKEILKGLASGTIDIAIGTHRLLSKDVMWKKLGLLVVDEEQRFGVAAKEHLKELEKGLDVLTLSATPLPRTLSMALSHVKRMSALRDAPEGRIAPYTFVVPYQKEIVKSAIENEVQRKGRMYVLEGRIHRIRATLEMLAALVPKRTVGYIHGRMSEEKLVETMNQFREGRLEILVSTTIIENGIDLSDVNTLIVSDSTLFGLSELHQLRGRVGRGRVESFAYFLYNPKRIGPKAKERLDIISSMQFLGAGSMIAERDLEMRGAGNILGKEQSGAARAVGLNLYSQFLAEAVEKLRGM